MASKLKVQWRVQVRKSRAHRWVNKGLFETRDAARKDAMWRRVLSLFWRAGRSSVINGYGFGNTRVQRYQKGCV